MSLNKYISGGNEKSLLPIIGVLILEYLNLDSLDAAFRGSNAASNPVTLAALRCITRPYLLVTALICKTYYIKYYSY